MKSALLSCFCLLLSQSVISQSNYQINELSDQRFAIFGSARNIGYPPLYDSVWYLSVQPPPAGGHLYYAIDAKTRELTYFKEVGLAALQDEEIVWIDRKLCDVYFEPVFDREIDNYYGKINGRYLIKVDDQFLLYHPKEGEKIIYSSPDAGLSIENQAFFVIEDRQLDQTVIFDKDGTRTGVITGTSRFVFLTENDHLFMINTEKIGIYNCFDREGNLLAEDIEEYVWLQHLAILQPEYGKAMFFRGKELVDPPVPIKHGRYLTESYFEYQDENGQKGVMDDAFNILVPAGYEEIDLLDKAFFLATDRNNQLHIFTMSGEEIIPDSPIAHDYKKDLFNTNTDKEYVGPPVFQLNLSDYIYYVTVDNYFNCKIFSKDWKLLLSVHSTYEDFPKYYRGPTAYFLPLPVEIIDVHRKYASVSEPEFFVIANSHFSYNICDQHGQLLFEEPYGHIFQFSNNLFLVSERGQGGGILIEIK